MGRGLYYSRMHQDKVGRVLLSQDASDKVGRGFYYPRMHQDKVGRDCTIPGCIRMRWRGGCTVLECMASSVGSVKEGRRTDRHV